MKIVNTYVVANFWKKMYIGYKKLEKANKNRQHFTMKQASMEPRKLKANLAKCCASYLDNL